MLDAPNLLNANQDTSVTWECVWSPTGRLQPIFARCTSKQPIPRPPAPVVRLTSNRTSDVDTNLLVKFRQSVTSALQAVPEVARRAKRARSEDQVRLQTMLRLRVSCVTRARSPTQIGLDATIAIKYLTAIIRRTPQLESNA